MKIKKLLKKKSLRPRVKASGNSESKNNEI